MKPTEKKSFFKWKSVEKSQLKCQDEKCDEIKKNRISLFYVNFILCDIELILKKKKW